MTWTGETQTCKLGARTHVFGQVSTYTFKKPVIKSSDIQLFSPNAGIWSCQVSMESLVSAVVGSWVIAALPSFSYLPSPQAALLPDLPEMLVWDPRSHISLAISMGCKLVSTSRLSIGQCPKSSCKVEIGYGPNDPGESLAKPLFCTDSPLQQVCIIYMVCASEW